MATTAIERARAKLQQLEAEWKQRADAEAKQRAALRIVITRAENAEKEKARKARTRGLIVLGGWVARHHPQYLAEAILLEPKKDKRRALEIVAATLEAGDKIDG